MRSSGNPKGSSGVTLAVIMLAEFKRAMAAAQRYEDLKRAGSTKLFADLPRLIFAEFYCFAGTTEPRSRGSNRFLWEANSLPISLLGRNVDVGSIR